MVWAKIQSLSRNLFRKSTVESDLDEEVQAFVEMSAQEQIERGSSPEEARRNILADLGGAERLKQAVREERSGSALESVAQDLRFGLRQITKSSGLAATVVLTLALSIGITTAVFSVLYAMVIRPLPYNDVSRIVFLETHSANGGTQWASYPEYADWRRMSHSFSALAGFNPLGTVGLEGGSSPVALNAIAGTDNFFQVFGVNPILGRTFAPGEDQNGRNDVVVLS